MSAHRSVRPGATEADVLIGGFCSSAKGYEPLRTAMQEASGRTTVFMGLTRWTMVRFEHNPEYPRVLYRQALYIAKQLKQRDIRRVRLFGHSLGAALAMIVADAFAEVLEVEKVVLLNPACIQVDGTWTTGKRFVRKLWGDVIDTWRHPDKSVRHILRISSGGVFRYVLNVPRAVIEGVVISRRAMFASLYPRLAQQEIPVFIGYGERDTLFLAEAIVEACAELPDGHVFMLEGVGHDAQFFPIQTTTALKRHGVL